MTRERYIALLVLSMAASLVCPAWSQTKSSSQTKATENAPEIPYANMPPAAVPFGRYIKPYKEWYVSPSTMAYTGPARNDPDGNPAKLKAINIGFLGPLDSYNPISIYGVPMLHGAQLAMEQANAHGGYHGKPFALKIHDDLALWGASSMAIVDMYFKDHDWAMLGSVDSASTHIELRATLKLELPIMDTATNDPTVTETRVQWLLHNFPDDRQEGYALADYIFNQRKLSRIGVLQVNNRYGRAGEEVFFDTARRIGHEPVVDVWYAVGTTDFSSQLQTLQSSGIDALVIWGNAEEAGHILKQMRAMGMHQPVFGSSRTCYPQVISAAGAAANGFTMVTPMDPTRTDPRWVNFRKAYMEQYHVAPDPYAAYAYDGMNMLIHAIRVAGLNRARIMDQLRTYEMKGYRGAGGYQFFDYTLNNIAPLTFAQVQNGKFIYWPERRTDWKGKHLPFLPETASVSGHAQ
jgi:ABC-type branched-subunit amino acid transport system substrate-binding protein